MDEDRIFHEYLPIIDIGSGKLQLKEPDLE